jgi:hypothetical protein
MGIAPSLGGHIIMCGEQLGLEPEARAFYCRTLAVLERARVDVLIGGAYAFARYTGIERHTKDFDVFVRQGDFRRTLSALRKAGYETEVTFPHWLGKARCGDFFVDVIYGSGNGVTAVDDDWFRHAVPDAVFEVPVKLVPCEEMIWSKSLIQERERFDGADVAHLVLARADKLDWARLIDRFGPNWRVLLSHLVLFGFVYPSEAHRLPKHVLRELLGRLEEEVDAPVGTERVCRGTLLSRQQYLFDVQERGFMDPRELPNNPMTNTDIAVWTAGISVDGALH